MDALDRGGPRARELYLMLRERMEAFERTNGDSFDEKVMKYWISMRSSRKGKVFAEIRLNKQDIDIFILPEASQLVDPTNLTRPVPLNQGWGWFRSRFWLRNETELGSALRLIQQSYHSA